MADAAYLTALISGDLSGIDPEFIEQRKKQIAEATERSDENFVKRNVESGLDSFVASAKGTISKIMETKMAGGGVGGMNPDSDQLLVGLMSKVRKTTEDLSQGARKSSEEQYKELQRVSRMAADADFIGGDNERLGQAIRSVTQSLAQLGATAPTGGIGIIGGFGVTAANDAYHEAKAAGKSEQEALSYAERSGLIEAGITSIFSAAGRVMGNGVGGLETLKSFRGVAKEGVAGALKEVGIRTVSELSEENLIGLAQAYNSMASDINPDAMDADQLRDMVFDTTLATLMTMGVAETAKGAVGAVIPKAKPKEAEQQTPATDSTPVPEIQEAPQPIVLTPEEKQNVEQQNQSMKLADLDPESDTDVSRKKFLEILRTDKLPDEYRNKAQRKQAILDARANVEASIAAQNEALGGLQDEAQQAEETVQPTEEVAGVVGDSGSVRPEGGDSQSGVEPVGPVEAADVGGGVQATPDTQADQETAGTQEQGQAASEVVDRTAKIERIVEAARRPKSSVVPRKSVKDTKGKWHNPQGVPGGVTLTGESRIDGYVYEMPDGTRGGKLYPTKEDAEDAQNRRIENNDAQFRQSLQGMTDEELEAQSQYWLKNEKPSTEPATTQDAPSPIKTLTGSVQNDRILKKLRERAKKGRGMTAGDEKSLKLNEARAKANPSKWKPGYGVGYRVDGKQINRGFRVVSVDPETKTATLRQVADTGLTSTGGNFDRAQNTTVHIADLVRDKKYDGTTPTPAQVESSPEPTADIEADSPEIDEQIRQIEVEVGDIVQDLDLRRRQMINNTQLAEMPDGTPYEDAYGADWDTTSEAEREAIIEKDYQAEIVANQQAAQSRIQDIRDTPVDPNAGFKAIQQEQFLPSDAPVVRDDGTVVDPGKQGGIAIGKKKQPTEAQPSERPMPRSKEEKDYIKKLRRLSPEEIENLPAEDRMLLANIDLDMVKSAESAKSRAAAIAQLTKAEEHLPNDPYYAPARTLFRQLKETMTNAFRDTKERLDAIKEPLGDDPVKLRIFERYLMLKNLEESYKRGELGSFGYQSLAEVQADLATYEEQAMADPDIQKAIENRKVIIDELTQMLIDADQLGDGVNREEYYHHQINQYVLANSSSWWGKLVGRVTGEPLHVYQERKSNPKTRTGKLVRSVAGFAKARVESRSVDDEGYTTGSRSAKYDPNTDYLQSEFEFMMDAFQKIETEKILREFERIYDQTALYKTKQAVANDLAFVGGKENLDKLRTLKKQYSALSEENRNSDAGRSIRTQIIKVDPRFVEDEKFTKAMNEVKGFATDGSIKFPTKRYEKAIGSTLPDNQNLSNDLHSALQWLVSIEGSEAVSPEARKSAKNVLDALDAKSKITQEKLGDDFVSWSKIAYDDESIRNWSPQENSPLYQAKTISDQVKNSIEEALRNKKSPDIPEHFYRTVQVMSGNRHSILIPTPLAEQLDNVRAYRAANKVSELSRRLTSDLKLWFTHNPFMFIPYTIRNSTGDMSGAIAGNPWILKDTVMEAIPELKRVALGQAMPSDNYKAMERNGVFSSSHVYGDMADLARSREYRRYFDSLRGNSWKWYNAPRKVIDLYFDFVTDISQRREAVLRYGAALHYLDKMKKGEKFDYGASNPAEIDEIRKALGNDVAAAQLSRNLLGDYGNLSVTAEHIRNHIWPFISYSYINFARYFQITRNAFRNDWRNNTSKAASYLAYKTSLAFLMYGAMAAWNHLMFPDEEEQLSDFERSIPHLILGRLENGDPLILRNTDSLGELFEWFGLNDIVSDVFSGFRDIRTGQQTPEDAMKEMGKALGNKFSSGLNAVYKIPVEVMTGYSSFPDVFNPRRVPRDELLFGGLGMNDEYAAVKGFMTGNGQAARENYFARTMVGVSSLNQNNLGELYRLMDIYTKQRDDIPDSNFGGGISPNRVLKQALINNDKENFEKALVGFFRRGGNLDKFERFRNNFDPLHGFGSGTDEQKKEQLDTFWNEFLTPKQATRMEAARNYANDLSVKAYLWYKDAVEKMGPEQIEKFEKEHAELVTRIVAPLGSPRQTTRAKEEAMQIEREAAIKRLEDMGITRDDIRGSLRTFQRNATKDQRKSDDFVRRVLGRSRELAEANEQDQ